jgi:hypothetical protein
MVHAGSIMREPPHDAASIARGLLADETRTARLCDRHPGVPAEIVEHHVKRAAVQLTGEARIPDYLPILIERRASESLRECRGLDPSAYAP